ncbi:MAG: aminotransferase class V-fold PLP-dependent enzyme [Balneolaceae bacterium]|nr:aminotransferase class V-fold PLP-dependent enzyme [Balneolaceae bacterium]
MNHYGDYLPLLKESLRKLDRWRDSFGEDYHDALADGEKLKEILNRVGERLEGNYPFHHPQYAGQMLKPPHPIAWLTYMLTATVNPNNHALDGGPPTSEMEKEVIRKLSDFVGYDDRSLGHLTSTGTIANLEALFIGREIHPGKHIAASSNAHYTHSRMSRLLNAPFLEIPVSATGEPDLGFIRKSAEKIGTLVVTMGTTGLGHVEPLGEMISIAREHGIRVHIDAAYGGFFKLISGDLPSSAEWDLMHEADSIVIDPHKHALQPYGSGSVLYKDASIVRYFKHDSPYTYFTSDELHLGEISIECSRAGASAAALWATLELLPLNRNGLGSLLAATRAASIRFHHHVEESNRFENVSEPALDINGYFKIPGQKKLSAVSELSRQIFDGGLKSRDKGYHLSLFTLPADSFTSQFPEFDANEDKVIILRSVFMKPEHKLFVDELAERIGI